MLRVEKSLADFVVVIPMRKSVAFALVSLFTLPFQASAETRIFRGVAAIEKVTQPCIDVAGFNVDSYLSFNYFYYNGTVNQKDVIGIFTGRSAFRMQPNDSSSTLSGAVATSDTVIYGELALSTYTSTSNLAITSAGVNPLSTTLNLKVIGTINDFFATGCTITVHGLLIVDPGAS